MITITVVLGTAREGRESEKVAQYIMEQLGVRGDISAMLADVRDYVGAPITQPPWGSSPVEKWKKQVADSDAFIIVTPEYNRGYPGELKLLLDSAYDEYAHKPVALVGVSSGVVGGARVGEHIKPVLIELKLVPMRDALYISKVKEFSPDEARDTAFGKIVDTLVRYAEALKSLR